MRFLADNPILLRKYLTSSSSALTSKHVRALQRIKRKKNWLKKVSMIQVLPQSRSTRVTLTSIHHFDLIDNNKYARALQHV